MLLIILLLFPLTLMAEVFVISNYPLRKNNIESIIKGENYEEVVQMMKSIKDIKDVRISREGDKVYVYIERYPIVKKIYIKGNMAVLREEILSYLGFYENMPLRGPEFNERDVEERVKRLYMDKGFLDVAVGVTLDMDAEGYAEVYIGIYEGPVYFTESGVYKNSTYEPTLLDLKIGLVRGRVFKESFFREGVFPLQDFYTKEGFWDSFVYYEGVEKMQLKKPFYQVLAPSDKTIGKRPLRILGAISDGIANLLGHPMGTLKAITGRGHIARPVFNVVEGKKYRILWEGVHFFKEEELTRISGLAEKGVDPFSLQEAKESIINKYHRKGFFEVKVEHQVDEKGVVFKVEEGPRYRAFGEGLEEDYYDEDLLEFTLKKRLEGLFREGYRLAEGNIHREIFKEDKRVRVIMEIKPGKKQIIRDFVYAGENREIKKIFSKHRGKLPALFNTDLVETLNIDIQKYFLKKGLMDGDYDIQIKADEEGDTLYYTYLYSIREGPTYQLGETIHYGYEKTTLRELSYMTEKGKHYSEALNEKALHNMLNSGIFSGVSIDTFVDKEKRVVHRLIQVSEDQRGILDLSLGYNTEEKLSLETFLGAKNLLGIGMTAGAKYRRTGKRELYDLSLQDNFLLSSRYWFKSNIFKSYEEHKSYDLDSRGLNLQLGYRISTNTSVGPIFSILKNKVDGRSFSIRKYSVFLLREYKDDIFSPNRLHYNSVNLSFAEGDAHYTKFDLSTYYLIPLRRDLKLSFKVAGGAIWGEAPIFERFFLGGLRDLRGYAFEEIGQPTGRKYYGFGRIELITPLKGPLVWVLFGDAGAAGNKLEDLPKDIKWSLGSGVGINTPVGPVRLDLAFPMDRNWLKKYKVYLSVGYYY
ncbi:MAG: BamA/TamA family outer membrane protein [Aquificaceae bacterium]|nr:BamA/TamA family outer membrane protein [Aquificaceae bacterium]